MIIDAQTVKVRVLGDVVDGGPPPVPAEPEAVLGPDLPVSGACERILPSSPPASLLHRYGRIRRPNEYLWHAALHPLNLVFLGLSGLAFGLSSVLYLPLVGLVELVILLGLPRCVGYRQAVDFSLAQRARDQAALQRRGRLLRLSDAHRAEYHRLDGIVERLYGRRGGRGPVEAELEVLLSSYLELAGTWAELDCMIDRATVSLAAQPHAELRLLENAPYRSRGGRTLRRLVSRRRAVNRRMLRIRRWANEQRALAGHRLATIVQVIELAQVDAMAPERLLALDGEVERLIDDTDHREAVRRQLAGLDA